MPFNIGDRVQRRSNLEQIGMISEISELHAGLQYYRVFWGGNLGTTTVPENDLQIYHEPAGPIENLKNLNLASYKDFLRILTYFKLNKDQPLQNNIYAFNASRTRFYPYQFKPLIKILNSQNNRILICDEVGLGKTIEAGLILTEIRARQNVQRVLVICPSKLTPKWKMELKKRFGEEFEIFDNQRMKEWLAEYSENQTKKLNAIISLEGIRNKDILEQISDISPLFDLVVFDEAHYMRNNGTQQHRVGKVLSQISDLMIMLTATPIHLGNENLYSLLNILDEEDFSDFNSAQERFDQNIHIIKSQMCMSHIPPNITDAKIFLEIIEQSSYLQNNPLLHQITDKIDSIAHINIASNQYRRAVIEIQRDLSELNLLSHIFTRTKKRDVHTNFPRRHAFPIEVDLSEKEKEFYNAVTNFIRSENEHRNSIIQRWLLNMPQRRMASSIPAMIKFYREEFGLNANDNPEDGYDLELNIEEINIIDMANPRNHLRQIIQNWAVEDSKYEKLRYILRELKRNEGQIKVLIFAFFKGTLYHLNQKLAQDSFRSVLICGDTSIQERNETINKFKESPDIEILLSSRVGSEGLDFQFCNTIVNYDIPWNPMEIEQRIGRLDRIGQEANVINIYNFWVKGTIEERILKKLYDRIHIFEQSIGELEPILGEIMDQLEDEIFSRNLTPYEEDEIAERKFQIIEQRQQEMANLENQAAQFIGTDAFFEEEINAIKKNRRYVTGEQLKKFVYDFLREYCPRTRLQFDENNKIGKLTCDQELINILLRHNALDMGHFIHNQNLKVTFDSQVAYANPNIEFINVLHPLVIVLIKEYQRRADVNFINAQYISLNHDLLETLPLNRGIYFYFIYLVKVFAAKPLFSIEYVVLDESANEVLDITQTESLIGIMLEMGEEPIEFAPDIHEDAIQNICIKANQIFLSNLGKLRTELENNNAKFLDVRLRSHEDHYNRRINKIQNTLDNARMNNKPEHYIRMLEGTIRRLRNELTQKRTELERRRNIGVDHNEIVAGILRVV